MHLSRWHFSLLLCVAVGLSACTPDRRKSLGEQSQATFYVETLTGTSERGPVSADSPWKVPTSIRAGFYACLKDSSTNQDLRNQEFFVSLPGTTTGYKARTNDSGCLRWTEDTIPFNFYAGRSGWVTVQRVLQGRGANTGSRTVDIAINPWATGDRARDDGKSIIYLKDGDHGFVPDNLVPAVESRMYLAGDGKSQGSSQLVIQNVRITSIPEAEGNGFVTKTFSVEMEPRIRSLRANGEVYYSDVPDGDFNVWMQILAAQAGPQMDQKVIILGGEPFAVGKVVDGKLKVEIRVRQDRIANQGSLELAMKVAPRSLSSLASIRPSHGLYRLGLGNVPSDGGASIYSMCLENSPRCDFTRIVEGAKNYQDLVKAGYLRPYQRYVFTNLRLRFLMVQPGETATQRTVSYTASTCITDMESGRPLAKTPMVIHYEKAESQNAEVERDTVAKETDDSGCLNWDGFVFHKYYQSEEYFTRTVSIEKASGFKETFKFYVNPWDTNINFGFDQREFTAEKIADITGRRKIRSRFFLGGYQYHTVRFLYNIDPFMDLEVKKTVLMELSPEVLRYSGIKDARKMTENLRDGIYLLKVAIQKSYLDPRDNSHLLISDEKYQAKMEKVGSRELATKEYITTNTVLVRVVSGLIIVPIELTMRDLRLMRVRSNFIMQLETVDERLIQAYHVFKKHAINAQDLENKLREFREKIKDANMSLTDTQLKGDDKDISPALKGIVDEREKLRLAENADAAAADLEARVKKTQELIGSSLFYLKQRLETGGALGMYLNSSGKATDVPVEVLRDTSITDNFEMSPEMLQELKTALNVNDFSEVSLPSKEEVDPNIFIEPDSGLEKRSFVGPVIFLSNAYSDSARATDNLDEAGCTDPKKNPSVLKLSQDALYANLKEKQTQLYGHPKDGKGEQASNQYPSVWVPESQLEGRRQNNAYQFSKYFGALTHLCYKQVDDLIQEEKQLKEDRENQAVATSLKSNFIDFVSKIGINLEFVSLTDEPLVRLKKGCNGPAAQCLEATTEGTIPASKLSALVNTDLKKTTRYANVMQNTPMSIFTGAATSDKADWDSKDYDKLFFSRSFANRVGLCNLLANRIMPEIDAANKANKLTSMGMAQIRAAIVARCTEENGLIHDIKYHVNRTGEYTFLGGLNLNINVGQSFSTGWSRSWSAGAEIADVIGPLASMGSAMVGFFFKPVSLKVGSSMSESEGTSISESTYLVSQIAGFQLDLLRYEKCAVVSLSPQAFRNLRWDWGDNAIVRTVNSIVPRGTWMNYDDPRLADALRHGYMVCEGSGRDFNPPTSVKESYFYFTQHFTEGDMLDQADLYNHPWLLGMRGMRDFVAFANRVRAQETVGLGEFLKGVTGITPEKKKAWALNHMTWIYENVFPSFPGFYTVLERGEDIQFLLEQSHAKLSKVDADPNGEITRRKLLINPGVSQQGLAPESK
ncbi:MAG: hypothetical protein KF799_11145 [Bdellovibrionales bacterium]|nr:hypothetical protein [Bdellovibrionales bacterium]